MKDLLILPDLFCPFPDEVHPQAEAADQHATEWMLRHRLVIDRAEQQRFARSKIGWLAARTTPRSDLESLNLVADWMIWLLSFDDAYAEESESRISAGALVRRLAPYLQLLEAPQSLPATVDPFQESLRDLRQRFVQRGLSTQLQRFTNAVQRHFFALVWEAGNRADEIWPNLEDYLAMRVDASGVPTCTALLDVAGGYVLDDRELALHEVRSLTRMAVNAICLANDVYSYSKEAARGTRPLNLPNLLRERQGCSQQEALEETARRHDAEIEAFRGLASKLARDASPELQLYISGLQSWIRGNLTWSRETARYATVEVSDS